VYKWRQYRRKYYLPTTIIVTVHLYSVVRAVPYQRIFAAINSNVAGMCAEAAAADKTAAGCVYLPVNQKPHVIGRQALWAIH